MSVHDPLVSVIMPVYNRAWCIANAIESVLRITSHELELLIVDDGCSDGTTEILEKYSKKLPQKIRKLSHPNHANFGIAKSRNLALRQSRGKYVAFLDSDDLYLENRFVNSLTALETNPDWLGCIEPYILEEIDSGAASTMRTPLDGVPSSDSGWLRAMLFENDYWNVPVITLRRDSALMFGGFEESLKVGEDTVLWVKLAASGLIGIAQTKQAVSIVRRHEANSWRGINQEESGLLYLNMLLCAGRWLEHNRYDWSAQQSLIDHRIVTFLIELLSNSKLCRSSRLIACLRVARYRPFVLGKKEILGNLTRLLIS